MLHNVLFSIYIFSVLKRYDYLKSALAWRRDGRRFVAEGGSTAAAAASCDEILLLGT